MDCPPEGYVKGQRPDRDPDTDSDTSTDSGLVRGCCDFTCGRILDAGEEVWGGGTIISEIRSLDCSDECQRECERIDLEVLSCEEC